MIWDLLIEDPHSKVLDLWEDPIKGSVVSGITEIIATSSKEVLDLLKLGNLMRT